MNPFLTTTLCVRLWMLACMAWLLTTAIDLAAQPVAVRSTESSLSLASRGIGINVDTNATVAAQFDGSGGLVVTASGGDIWATKDSFEYVYQTLSGNGEVVVKLSGVDATNEWAKAGLMIRESLAPESRHVLLAGTLANGVAFIWREQTGSPSGIAHLSKLPNTTWLKLSRTGDILSAYVSADGINWTLVEWRSVKMLAQVFVGVAVSARSPQAICRAKFDHLQIRSTSATDISPAVGNGNGLLGQYFTKADLSGAPAFVQIDPVVDFDWGFGFPVGLRQRNDFGIRWSGEIEAQFTEAYTFHLESDDGARMWLGGNLIIDHWIPPHPVKEATATVSLNAGQKYAIRIEYYDETEIAAVRLSWSSPSTPKRVVPQSQLDGSLPEATQGVNIRSPSVADEFKGATNELASPWQQSDVGKGSGGGAVENNGSMTVRGFGENIWGRADAFHYVYQPLEGDGQIVAHVRDIQGGQAWGKAGLMIRETLDADAKHVSVFGTVAHGLLFNQRPKTGNRTFDSTDLRYESPYWLKLIRWGNVMSGYMSTNGQDWRLVDRAMVEMTPNVYIGIAVNSRTDQSETTVWFEGVEIQPAEAPEPVPITGSGDGLKAEFFDHPNLIGAPSGIRVDERLDFIWGGAPPIPQRSSSRFSARWSGEVQARYTEPVAFRLASRYGARVWLNEKLIMDSQKNPNGNSYLDASADLVAGQKYLLRVECFDCAGDAQGRLMWSSPSFPRRTIPQSQFYSQPTDTDGDGMPDLWEAAYGLSPRIPTDAAEDPDEDGLSNLDEYRHYTDPHKADTDGDGVPDRWETMYGLNPRSLEDRLEDPDHDGLANADEYRMNTDPGNADSDGDGLDDGVEVVETGSNPLVGDIDNIRTVTEAAGAASVNHLGGWVVDGTALHAVEGRGWAEYLLNVPKADVYRLEVSGLSGNDRDSNRRFELLPSVDGEELGRVVLTADSVTSGAAWRITPWLKAGEHRVRIYWDNAIWDRSFKVVAVRLQELEGPDTDNNGVKDWVERRVRTLCGVNASSTVPSFVSPACLEGRGRYPSMMHFSSGLQPRPGTAGRWFVNVPLAVGTATTVITSFENDALVLTNNIVWQPVNLLASDDQIIREGDALLLSAHPIEAQTGQMEIRVAEGTIYSSSVGQPVSHRFERAGVYVVTGTFSGRKVATQTRSINVRVLSASLPPATAAWVDKRRSWECEATAGVILQPDSRVVLAGEAEMAATNGALSFKLGARLPEDCSILARAGDNGPVLSAAGVEGFHLWSGFETGMRRLARYEDGTELVEMGLVMSPLRTNVTVKVEVHAAGVLFEDGTTMQVLRANDFDPLGRARVRFLKPASVKTSACHRTKAYQGGTLLGVYP